MPALSLERWLAEPGAVVAEIFAEGGPVAAAMPEYARNPVQVEYATILATAAVRGADPATRGYVTPVEAGTGIGKSISILVVAGINAVLRGKRALVTTFTRALNRQMSGADRDVALAVVEAMTGMRPGIALRRPRSAFASPTRCRQQAGLMRAEAPGKPEALASALNASAEVLMHLAEWTEAENADALHVVDGHFRGLIETFLDQHPDAAGPLSDVPFDLYALEHDSPAVEQGWYSAYAALAEDADVLIATHAALVRDQSFYGSVLDRNGEGYSLVVMDEAHRIEQAGALALGVKRALSSFRREAELVSPIAAALPAGVQRDELISLGLDQAARGEAILDEVVHLGQRVTSRNRDVPVVGTEPWIGVLRQAQAATSRIVRILEGVPGENAKGAIARLAGRANDVAIFLDTIDRLQGQAQILKGMEIPRHLMVFSDPMLSFSPRTSEPSIYVKPRFGARVVGRLWSSRQEPRADAVVVTSATMGMPMPDGGTSFNSLLKSIGLSPADGPYHRDLARSLEARELGTMEELILAHPEAPLPSRRTAELADGESHRNPAWLEYAAGGIREASRDVWHPSGRNRVVVLCTSFDEAAAFGEALGGLGVPNVLVRGHDDHIDTGFDALARLDMGVLVTTGAFDGIDRPGLMQHLIVPRLPMSGFDGRAFATRAIGNDVLVRRIDEEAVMTLRQAIGRAFRVRSDACKVWLLDPRIGVPDALMMIPNPAANQMFLRAIPRRFEDRLETARLYLPEQPR